MWTPPLLAYRVSGCMDVTLKSRLGLSATKLRQPIVALTKTLIDVSRWPFATILGDAAVQSLSARSEHSASRR